MTLHDAPAHRRITARTEGNGIVSKKKDKKKDKKKKKK